MTETNDGGPAFPGGESYYTEDARGHRRKHGKDPSQKGMTLRDYFAAAALTGLLAHGADYFEDAAQSAYAAADAMLAERERAGGEG